MKGLLLKDWYVIRKVYWTYLLIILVFSGVYVWADGRSSMIWYPCFIAQLTVVSLMSYEEAGKWSQFAGTLPYTRAQIVSEKYILSLLAAAFVLGLIVAARGLRMLRGVNVEALQNLLGLLNLNLIYGTVCLPMIFRFGREKGMLFAGCLAGVFTGIGGFLLAERQIDLSAAWVTGIAVVLFVLSWLASLRIYQKREL